MRQQRVVGVDINDADPADAINVFLHVLNRQRELGLCPRTEHTLVEHLFLGDAKVVFYSNASGGVISIVEGNELDFEDVEELVMLVFEQRKARAIREREKRAAEALKIDEPGDADEEAGPQPAPTDPA